MSYNKYSLELKIQAAKLYVAGVSSLAVAEQLGITLTPTDLNKGMCHNVRNWGKSHSAGTLMSNHKVVEVGKCSSNITYINVSTMIDNVRKLSLSADKAEEHAKATRKAVHNMQQTLEDSSVYQEYMSMKALQKKFYK